jgi:nucleoside-diphosphate-sugar epimerase
VGVVIVTGSGGLVGSACVRRFMGHQGAELHGCLSYLMRCAVAGEHSTVFGHTGNQVRDDLRAADVASAPFHAGLRAGEDPLGREPTYDLERTLREIHDTNVEHWSAGPAAGVVPERV